MGEMGSGNAIEGKYSHQLATVLGYIFAPLGGLLGTIFGIYLVTGQPPRAKYHGRTVLTIAVLMTLFWIFMRVALTQ